LQQHRRCTQITEVLQFHRVDDETDRCGIEKNRSKKKGYSREEIELRARVIVNCQTDEDKDGSDRCDEFELSLANNKGENGGGRIRRKLNISEETFSTPSRFARRRRTNPCKPNCKRLQLQSSRRKGAGYSASGRNYSLRMGRGAYWSQVTMNGVGDEMQGRRQSFGKPSDTKGMLHVR
jgi:hypothetical protein